MYRFSHTCTCMYSDQLSNICEFLAYTDHTDAFSLPCSKGDIENAVKFLEMFVNVTEKAGLKDSLAKACSATGSMYTTLVRIV